MENSINKVLESRINKMLNLAFAIQAMRVAIPETEEIYSFKQLGTLVSVYVKDNISTEMLIKHDVDLEIIDGIFNVVSVCDLKFTLVNVESMYSLSKDRITSYIFNLENLKSLLSESIADYVDEPTTDSASKELTVVNTNGELVNGSDSDTGMPNEMMDQYLMGEIMNMAAGNPMLSIALMQKKVEGKLNRANMMKIMSAAPNGYMRGGMSQMMVMQIINKL